MPNKITTSKNGTPIPDKAKYYIILLEIMVNLLPLLTMSVIMLLAGLGIFGGGTNVLYFVLAGIGFASSIVLLMSVVTFMRGILVPIYRMGARFFRLFNDEEREIIMTASNGNYTGIVMNSVDLFGGKKSVYDRAAKMEEVFGEMTLCSADISFRNNVGNDESIVVIPDIWKEKYPDIDMLQVDVIDGRVHPDDRAVFDEAYRTLKRKAGRSMSVGVQFRITPKQFVNVTINARSVLSSADEMIIVGAIIDNNSITELENAIREKYLMYHFALQAVTDVIYETDIPSDTITITNPNRYIELFGDTQDGRSYTVMKKQYQERIHPDYREDFVDRFCNLDHLLYMPDMRMSYEYKVSNRNKEWIWVRHTLSCIKAENNRVVKLIGLVTDINERKHNDMKKLYDTQHDSATGVYLRSIIEKEYNLEVEAGNLSIGVLLFKISNYKSILAQYGVNFTDAAMAAFATLIWANQIDGCSVGRLEDDVFVVLIKEMSMSGAARFLGERLLRAARMPLEVNGVAVNIETVIGASLLDDNEKSFGATLAHAREALAKSEQLGGFSYVEYGSELGARR